MYKILLSVLFLICIQLNAKMISFRVYEYEPIGIKQNSVFEFTSEGKFSNILKTELVRLVIEDKNRVREADDYYKEPFKAGPSRRSDYYVEINHRPIVTYNDFSGMSFEFTIRTLNADGVILQEKRKILALENTDIKNGGTNVLLKHRALAEEILQDWKNGLRANSRFIRIDMSALNGKCEMLDNAIDRLTFGLKIDLNLSSKEFTSKCKLDKDDTAFFNVIDKYTKTPTGSLHSLVEKLNETKPHIVQFKEQFQRAYVKQ